MKTFVTFLYLFILWILKIRPMSMMEFVSILARHMRTILFVADVGGWWKETILHINP